MRGGFKIIVFMKNTGIFIFRAYQYRPDADLLRNGQDAKKCIP